MTEETAGRRGRRVLVVDDNLDSAESLARLLELQGHETATAHDGVGAIGVAEAFHPNVIVLDLGLPRLDGHEVARRVRGTPWGKDVLLIASTGWGHADARRASIDAGFDHHLVKPLDLTQLATLIAAGRAVPQV
jgi:CheY-like chemotaxis protein